MKFLPLLSLLLFLLETTFSLQALPMLERGAERSEQEKRAGVGQEEAGRRLSDEQRSTTETVNLIEGINTLPSSTAATTTAAVAGEEPTDEAAAAPRADSIGSLGEHAVTAVPEQAQPRYRLGPDD
ncbi:MAG: hypothetical protein FJ390_08640, partial [Verrucomicrobia bacterium]|nr:hypothetical protein [Verrucomicrobiota bacterium]